ncbi:MAG: hypothetical protein LBC86_07230 [Oscillospiraceae bacterium]|jgi:hypothetical protein|nr:hypothetical protein [Oscillospiraceae bacterium]
MQKKSFLRLLLETFGYAAGANAMALIVTFSLLTFNAGTALMGIAVFCSVSLYLMMLFNAGHKDGELDRKLFNRKTIDKQQGNKWYILGGIVAGFFIIACALLLVFSVNSGEDGTVISGSYFSFVRIILSAIMALSLLFGELTNPVWAPFVFIGIFALTPFACRLGYWVGFYEKWTMENIMYAKKK